MNRLGRAVIALLAAWLAGLFVTLPFQVAVCIRNSDGDLHRFREFMPLVLGIWSVWTFVLALIGWMLVALPVAFLVNPRWLYRIRRALWVACFAVPVAATSLQFEVWKSLRPGVYVDKFNYGLYTAFALSYSVTMAAVYLRLTGRSIRSDDSGDA
jgi:hypothetical protein